ncbi:SPX domain-containing protein [Thamnocephalis sphaerospora]|uniref:SPX domain-containing protein n=1 Tax=Thamnocephalis sphaerospora TaxID=78915 RepID=A0A4P9XKC6_9FUNG|nr:SPX domain-containing protein [Thamnocephalis sphaerospora]|eukprot:RKP05700.1 SPX domain-containing protein [Thamnocephalis sphaerospora]
MASTELNVAADNDAHSDATEKHASKDSSKASVKEKEGDKARARSSTPMGGVRPVPEDRDDELTVIWDRLFKIHTAFFELHELLEKEKGAQKAARAPTAPVQIDEQEGKADVKSIVAALRMKFSHQLKFNAVPDWADHYVAYDQLKKLAYQIERDVVLANRLRDELEPEQETLLDARAQANHSFLPALDHELARITEFYVAKEGALYDEAGRLLSSVRSAETVNLAVEVRPTSTRSAASSTAIPCARLSSTPSLQQDRTPLLDTDDSGTAVQHRRTWSLGAAGSLPGLPNRALQERALETYVALVDLEGFVQLNYTAFGKILKKYDKITGNRVRKSYLNESVRAAYPFHEETKAQLADQIRSVAWAHSLAAGFASQEENAHFLQKQQRERVVFARNTVWRDMIGMERKVAAVGMQQISPREPVEPVRCCGVSVPRILLSRQVLLGVPCLVVFFYLLRAHYFADAMQQSCFAMLVFVSLLWAFEVLPLFVTSLLVPFLVVLLGVMRDDQGNQMPASGAARRIFGSMFNSVIMLLLGGFTIAAALSKHDIAKRVATFVLARAGTRPATVLLANMFVATFASMWISNVAAPVLCFSLIQPILRTLPAESPFSRCLVMGIALASNVGGMASPISSPQNLIALEVMKPTPSWPEWFMIALPVSIAADLAIWLLLLLVYRPSPANSPLQPLRASNDPITKEQVTVTAITLITIGLWCFEAHIEAYVGDMGVLALLPILVFFGFELLTKEDFNNFLWTVVVLAMGGIALGQAVNSSGLLYTVAEAIQKSVDGQPFWMVVVIFTAIVTVAATFVSHTVAALVFLPIVNEVGSAIPGAHPRILVMSAALMCSGAMGLPVSGFPNMNAAMLEDPTGKPYLRPADFLRSGIPATILALGTVLTVGGGIMYVTSF